MRAFEDIRGTTPLYVYGTAQGEQVWRDIRDRLKAKIATEQAILVPERTRDYDEHQEDQRELWNDQRRLNLLDRMLNNFRVIEPATTADVVDIGVIITYRQYDDNGKPRQPVTVQVGEYGMDDINAKPRIMAYENHLLLPLLGAKVGESRTFKLADNREYEFEILNIRLPQTQTPVRLVG